MFDANVQCYTGSMASWLKSSNAQAEAQHLAKFEVEAAEYRAAGPEVVRTVVDASPVQPAQRSRRRLTSALCCTKTTNMTLKRGETKKVTSTETMKKLASWSSPIFQASQRR